MIRSVALVGRDWNIILQELKEWHSFGADMKKAESNVPINA